MDPDRREKDDGPRGGAVGRLRVVEHHRVARTGILADCEDEVLLTDHFAAVFDGATSAEGPVWAGTTAGRFAAGTLAAALRRLDPTADAAATLRGLEDALRGALRALGLFARARGHPRGRPRSTMVVYSRARREVWRVGDGQALLLAGGRVAESLDGAAPAERSLASVRARVLRGALREGRTIDELRADDVGRAIIADALRSLRQVPKDARSPPSVAIDGFQSPPVEVLRVPETVDGLVLATDGYPRLWPDLARTERHPRDRLDGDPLMIGDPPATKGVPPGGVSFDDRSYVRIACGGRAAAAMPIEEAPLAEGARWISYGHVDPGGIGVEAMHRPGTPRRDAVTRRRVAAVARAIREGCLPGVYDGRRYVLVGAEAKGPAGGESPRTLLAFRDASYAAFLATNGWDPQRLAGLEADGLATDPRPAHRDLPPAALFASGFLNCLGACLFVVVEDDAGRPMTYLVRRRGGILSGYWDGSVDEGLSRRPSTGDEASPDDPRPDLQRFLHRAVREEAGLEPEESAVTVVAAGHDTWTLQPALVGWVESDLGMRAFRRRLARARGREEVAEVRWIPLEPDAVWETIRLLKREARVLPWVEVGLYGSLLSYRLRHGLDGEPVERLFGPVGRGWPGAAAP